MNSPVKSTAKPAPLGRGLSALFGDADTSFQPREANAAPQTAAVKGTPVKIAIEHVQPGAYQPRRHFDEEAIEGLAESIRERGILQPLLVRPLTEHPGSYEIIAGERRWRAAQRAGLHEVPALVREMTDREAMEVGLIENVQRQDLSPVEEAEGYKRLMDEFQHTQDGLSKVVGKSRPHIANLLRVLSLPVAVRQMLDGGSLSLGHARCLLSARNPLPLAQEIVKRGLSVRQAEVLCKREGTMGTNKRGAASPSSAIDADVLALEKDLSRLTGLKVSLNAQGKSGTLTLHYQDLDQLDMIVKKLRG